MASAFGRPQVSHSFRYMADVLLTPGASVAGDGVAGNVEWWAHHLKYDFACIANPTMPIGRLLVTGLIGSPFRLDHVKLAKPPVAKPCPTDVPPGS